MIHQRSLPTYFVGKTVEKPSSNKKLSTQVMISKHHFSRKEVKYLQEIADFQSRAEIYKMSLEYFFVPNEKGTVKEY